MDNNQNYNKPVAGINIILDEPLHFKAEKKIDSSEAIMGAILVLFIFGFPFIMSYGKKDEVSSVSPLIFILLLPIVFFLFYYKAQYQRHSIIEIVNNNISAIEKTIFGKVVTNIQTTIDTNMMTEVKKIVHEEVRERYTNKNKDVITYVVRYRTIDQKDKNYKFYDIMSGLNEEQAIFLSNKINEIILTKRKQLMNQ